MSVHLLRLKNLDALYEHTDNLRRQFTDDAEYLERFNADYNDRVFDLLEMFPDFMLHVKQNPKTYKGEIMAEIHSVFDIAWYSFAGRVADVTPLTDDDLIICSRKALF